jgi:hypothetical protein
MGVEGIDVRSALGYGLRLVEAISMMPFVCEVEISLCWDSHIGLSSLEVLALRHHHSLPISDLAFVEVEV